MKHLPADVDICGENGEYHTFSYDGPIFQSRIEVEIIKVERISYSFELENGKVENCDYCQGVFGST